MKRLLACLAALVATLPAAQVSPPVLATVEYAPIQAKLRTGYWLEQGALRGCVLYLQGLGDSIRNHAPSFDALNAAGYRVISFDYLGQGGSEGTMGDTRLRHALDNPESVTERHFYETRDKHYEIPVQGEWVWSLYAKVRGPSGADCVGAKKIVMGWSTGGLAAYRMAHERRADAVVLISPGMLPKFFVGDSQHRPSKLLTLQRVITPRSFTRNTFAGTPNPHVDPIKPGSPLYALPFSLNLLSVASESEQWDISLMIPGLVLLAGDDQYVKSGSTVNLLRDRAPHFEIVSYPDARHELDNELPEVAEDVRGQIVRFLNSVTARRK